MKECKTTIKKCEKCIAECGTKTDMKNCVQKIQPIFNRMVIFNTTNFSFHGNPDKIKLSDKSKSRKYRNK